ncbi:MAG: GGDEF domain-containing protein, partial [Clostridia bacterium]|nr:GGDEF domain-containing protein [Clostridia bacterium]
AIGGVIVVVLSFVIQISTYFVAKYLSYNISDNATFIALGAVCFVISIIFSYLLFTEENVEKGKERDLFRSFAYTDELTQVGNRHFAEELLMQINADKKSYTLFSIDLNDLKKTNDTWGHAEGDKMLQNFTDILTSVFSANNCSIARTGGDEFIVIAIHDENELHPEDCITKLKLMMETYNNEANSSRYKLSAAIGYVNSNDFVGQTPYELWNMADKRMYENKRELKKSSDSEGGFWDMLPGRE